MDRFVIKTSTTCNYIQDTNIGADSVGLNQPATVSKSKRGVPEATRYNIFTWPISHVVCPNYMYRFFENFEKIV